MARVVVLNDYRVLSRGKYQHDQQPHSSSSTHIRPRLEAHAVPRPVPIGPDLLQHPRGTAVGFLGLLPAGPGLFVGVQLVGQGPG